MEQEASLTYLKTSHTPICKAQWRLKTHSFTFKGLRLHHPWQAAIIGLNNLGLFILRVLNFIQQTFLSPSLPLHFQLQESCWKGFVSRKTPPCLPKSEAYCKTLVQCCSGSPLSLRERREQLQLEGKEDRRELKALWGKTELQRHSEKMNSCMSMQLSLKPGACV